MNAGIYREGAAASGLPLPRKRLWALTIVTGVIALVAINLSPMLLGVASRGSAGPAAAWRIVREGGILFTGTTLLLGLLAPIALTVLGAFVVRGKRVPPVLLFLGPALPFLVGILGAWAGNITTFGAIRGESVDPEQKMRIMAEGAAESMLNDVVSGFIACGCAIVACLAAASAAASIDVASASRETRPKRTGLVAASVAGGLWVVVAIVLAVLRLKHAGPLVVFSVLAVATMVPSAILAGNGAGVLRDWHDSKEASRMLAAIAIAGFCAVLGILAFERAIGASLESRALGAISGESVDPSQQARILFDAIDGQKFGTLAMVLHGVLGTATFAAALAPSISGGRHPFGASTIVAIGVSLILAATTFGLRHVRSSNVRFIAATSNDVAPAGIRLPTITRDFSRKSEGRTYGSRLVLDSSGADRDGASTECGTKLDVYADRDLTAAGLAAALTKRKCADPELAFVAKREHDPATIARLGELSAYLGGIGYVPATIVREPVKTDGPIDVRVVADDAIEIDGKRTPLPPPPVDGRFRATVVRFTFRPTDTVQRMVDVITRVRDSFGFSGWMVTTQIDIGLPSLRKAVTEDDFGSGLGAGLGPRTSPRAPSLRQGPTQVNGRLPPEVIQRIVRQNFGRFRLCYENGLRTDPKLGGRVTTKFVIDRSGAVTTVADGGSDLPNKSVVACVQNGFKALAFPQPEGGVVTVVYPIDFKPAAD